MWYKNFNKESWRLRIWRNKNLTFKYNDLGFGANFYSSSLRNLYLRVFGHEGPLRIFNMFLLITVISSYSYVSEKYWGE